MGHANPAGGNAWRADSPLAANDYRQKYFENRYAPSAARQASTASAPAESHYQVRDYRHIQAQGRYAANSSAAFESAPIQIQPAYTAGAPAAGYGNSAGNNLLPLAGLLADAVSALADYLRADEQQEPDSAYYRDD